MPSLLAEQRIGIEYAPITNVTEERGANWRIILILRININIENAKNKNKAKKHGSLIRLLILSRAVLCSVSQLEWPPAFASNGGREFVT